MTACTQKNDPIFYPLPNKIARRIELLRYCQATVPNWCNILKQTEHWPTWNLADITDEIEENFSEGNNSFSFQTSIALCSAAFNSPNISSARKLWKLNLAKTLSKWDFILRSQSPKNYFTTTTNSSKLTLEFSRSKDIENRFCTYTPFYPYFLIYLTSASFVF